MTDTPWQHVRPSPQDGRGVPLLPEPLLRRPRLDALLDSGRQRPLTLLAAPAGFGKTVALCAWLRTLPPGQPQVAWCSLRPSENGPRPFWRRIVAALAAHRPELGAVLPVGMHTISTTDINALVTALINAIAARPEPLLLVLDNYHAVRDPAVHSSVAFLLDHLPPQLRLIVATRTEPPLPLGNLRARGKLLEIRAQPLRCTREEAEAFLGDVLGLHQAAGVVQRADGWLAGLQLLGRQIQGAATGSGRGHSVPDYVQANVLPGLPDDTQGFLLHTSILDELCGDLCDAVTGRHDSQATLDRLMRDSLAALVTNGPRRWYCYDQLFTEAFRTLLRRRDAAAEPALHRRASDWYAAEGRAEPAVAHAIGARDWGRAAALVEAAIATPDLKRGQTTALLEQLWQLPPEAVRPSALLSLFSAEGHFVAGRLVEAERWMLAADQALAQQERRSSAGDTAKPAEEPASQAAPGMTPDQAAAHRAHPLALLRNQIAGYRAVAAAYYGRWDEAEAHCATLLGRVSGEEFPAIVAITATQAHVALARGRPMTTLPQLMGFSADLEARGSTELAVTTLTFAAPLLLAQGRLRELWRAAHQAAQLGTDVNDVPMFDAWSAYIYQAEVLREWNRLDEALAHLEDGGRLLLRSPYTIWEDHRRLVQARIEWALGRLDRAEAALEAVARHPLVADNPYQQAWMLAGERMRLWLAQGELRRAEGWAAECLASARHPSPFARAREDIALARLALALQNPGQALGLLAPLYAGAEVAGRLGDMIEVQLLRAQAHQQRGDQDLALEALGVAVSLAEPEGYIRRFVEEAPLHGLLFRLHQRTPLAGCGPYVRRVLEAWPAQEPGASAERDSGP